MRAMSRRTCRTRAVFSSWPLACWKRRLKISLPSPSSSPASSSSVLALVSEIFISDDLLALTDHEPRRNRQFGGGENERLARDVRRHAVELEHDASGFDAADPEFRRTLAAPHANLGRLLRHRHIGEDADPNPAGAADVACDGAARRLDLARRDPPGVRGLQPVSAEIQSGPALRETMDPPLMGLAVFASFWSQHDLSAQRFAPAPLMARRLPLAEPLFLRHRIMSEDLALEDPNLDAAHAVGGFGGPVAKIDVGAQGMKGHPAFAIPFHAGDLGSPEPARAIDPNALRAEPHRRLHGPLHRPAKGNTPFQLLCDAVSDQLRVDFRLANLDDVEADLAV